MLKNKSYKKLLLNLSSVRLVNCSNYFATNGLNSTQVKVDANNPPPSSRHVFSRDPGGPPGHLWIPV